MKSIEKDKNVKKEKKNEIVEWQNMTKQKKKAKEKKVQTKKNKHVAVV